MIFELLGSALHAKAFREAEKERQINKAKKPQEDYSLKFPVPSWVDFFSRNFGAGSESKAPQEV
jgi:hypothetical protein